MLTFLGFARIFKNMGTVIKETIHELSFGNVTLSWPLVIFQVQMQICETETLCFQNQRRIQGGRGSRPPLFWAVPPTPIFGGADLFRVFLQFLEGGPPFWEVKTFLGIFSSFPELDPPTPFQKSYIRPWKLSKVDTQFVLYTDRKPLWGFHWPCHIQGHRQSLPELNTIRQTGANISL